MDSVCTHIGDVIAVDLDLVLARDCIVAHNLVLKRSQRVRLQEGEVAGGSCAFSFLKSAGKHDHLLEASLSIIIQSHSALDLCVRRCDDIAIVHNTADVFIASLDWVLKRVIRKVATIDSHELATVL